MKDFTFTTDFVFVNRNWYFTYGIELLLRRRVPSSDVRSTETLRLDRRDLKQKLFSSFKKETNSMRIKHKNQ